jgi:hypothetical protein
MEKKIENKKTRLNTVIEWEKEESAIFFKNRIFRKEKRTSKADRTKK